MGKTDYTKIITFLDSLNVDYTEDRWKEPKTNFDFIRIEIDNSSMCSAGHVGMDLINGKFVGFSSWE